MGRGTAVLVAGLIMAGAALAHTGATGVVKERMEAMKAIGASMKAIATMIKGAAPYDAAKAAAAGEAIARHAGAIPDLFPEGSSGAPSEALPLIWTDWPDFLSATAALEERALDLAAAAGTAQNADALKAPFAALGETCKTCHEEFRAKE